VAQNRTEKGFADSHYPRYMHTCPGCGGWLILFKPQMQGDVGMEFYQSSCSKATLDHSFLRTRLLISNFCIYE
jgi:hypothetical protein